jgi:hypothetical protein
MAIGEKEKEKKLEWNQYKSGKEEESWIRSTKEHEHPSDKSGIRQQQTQNTGRLTVCSLAMQRAKKHIHPDVLNADKQPFLYYPRPLRRKVNIPRAPSAMSLL